MVSGEITYADSYDFDERIESGTVLTFFFEYLDARSRAFEGIIEELAEEYCDHVRFVAVDTEQSPDIAMRYGIDVLPGVIIFNNGEIVEQVEGANSPEVYKDILDSLI